MAMHTESRLAMPPEQRRRGTYSSAAPSALQRNAKRTNAHCTGPACHAAGTHSHAILTCAAVSQPSSTAENSCPKPPSSAGAASLCDAYIVVGRTTQKSYELAAANRHQHAYMCARFPKCSCICHPHTGTRLC